MSAMTVAHRFSAALLFLSAALLAANWSLRPGRAPVWLAAAVVLMGMAWAFVWALRRLNDDAPSRRAVSVLDGVLFASLTMAVVLAAKLALRLGVPGHPGFPQRAMMITIGAFLVFTANAIPKTLTPLAALKCDPAKWQAFHRAVGWTGVLIGLAFALAWAVLPLKAAMLATFILLPAAILLLFAQVVRFRALCQRSA